MTDSSFYRAFEDKYRGSRELIKSRLKVYLPLIAPLKTLYPHCKAIDIGCGRGEWLDLMQSAGVDAHGVDIDDGMLSACRELGLSAEMGDGVNYLKNLPDESRTIVSGFHIVEHISFQELQTLVQEALRVLVPGGLLIMETPNPENIRVATTNFYLDPTHIRPIPPQLLAFLPEYYGFYRSIIIRLQESNELSANPTPTLLDVITGVSPDYAVVAQKTASDIIVAAFHSVFTANSGLSLETLADRFDARIQRAEGRAKQAEEKALQAEEKAKQTEAALLAVYNSRSWRWTMPFRRLQK